MATNSNAPGAPDYNTAQSIIDGLVDSDLTGFWTDPSAALWIKACIAAGKSVGVAGCPSREVADFAFAVFGA